MLYKSPLPCLPFIQQNKMQFFLFPLLLAMAHTTAAVELVQSNQLRRVLTRTALREHGQKFMDFAFQSPGTQKNRVFGSIGHNLTVEYIKQKLDETGYYDTEYQSFQALFSQGNAYFVWGGDGFFETGWFTYGPAGSVAGDIVPVNEVGCTLADYPAAVEGNIALIKRGNCEFGLKVAYAGAAGAKGAVIYNNAPGPIAGGTLNYPSRPEGPYVPVGSISLEDGEFLLSLPYVAQGSLTVEATTEIRTTRNILATTKGGDKNNVVFAGAHTDSVSEGPGLNDNGSGAIGLLEIALKLTKWSVNNAVKFGWWSAEEFGLLGSNYYVEQLSPEGLGELALYLNADMIASPNFGYFVYDGDGSAFNITGPPGSTQIEKLFEEYFKEVGLPTEPTAFDGRSDYGPFLDAGVPCGGLFTGAEGKKTAAQVALWGGKAGISYDENYHQYGDTLENTNTGAWIQNTKALAHAIATYARNLTGIPRTAQRNGATVFGDCFHQKALKHVIFENMAAFGRILN
ncbi:hypothetical protein FN846DRAFT_1027508 [Sphaerosporella brunnea]|uniref:Peptide hydrolase n=1 Tax=Sphaerosporella brunnea TaxID=1250544 RepID=A0A5J5F0X9_9PEZI|nr:hypothetical protein FN846DRAFT_1027508 [Sphaerosporella brunnea]